MKPAPTVPDEDFFSLILRPQSNRIDDQRVGAPADRDKPRQMLPPVDVRNFQYSGSSVSVRSRDWD